MAQRPEAREYVLDRNYTIASVFGHRIVFRSGVPVGVPSELEHEALRIGAKPVDGQAAPVIVDDEELSSRVKNSGPDDPVARKKQIATAIGALQKANQRNDFTAAGRPKVSAMARVLGYEIDAKELDKVWADYHAEKQAEE